MEFYRYNDTNLFLTDLDLREIPFAYLLFPNNPDAVPDSMTLSQSWTSYTGIYVFLGKEVKKEEWENFVKVLESFFSTQPVPEYTGLMWLEDYTKLNQGPIIPPDRYSYCPFEICICIQNQQAAGPAEQNYFPTIIYTKKETSDNSIQIKNTVNVSIGTYNLPFIEGSYIFLNEASEQLEVSYPPLSGSLNPAYGKGMSISLSGEARGAIRGEACIHDFSPDTQTGWNIGLRYNMYSSLSIRSQFYPVFQLGNTTYVLFTMQWDPLRPTTTESTYLLFTGISFNLVRDANNPNQFSIQPDPNPGILSSFWKTIYGKSVLLKPLTNTNNPAMLVFQNYMDASGEAQGYYLAPAGDFEVVVKETKEQRHKLLCGLSGTECIEFNNGDVLTFYPGKPAFSDSYPVGTSGPDELLTDTCTTSWLTIKSVEQDPPPVYSSAPRTASLFGSSNVSAILEAFYAPAARFTAAATKDDEYCFPMVPYAGLAKGWPMSFNENDIAPFEQQIINTVRKQVISKIPVELSLNDGNAAEENSVTTPQGLLVTIKGLNWGKLLVAQNLEATKELSFTPPPGQSSIPVELRNAFQSDDLFLVISDNAHIGTFNNQINIENWNFNINVPKRDPDKDAEHQNILLFKFRKGAIIDLVTDSNNWTAPRTFNYDENQVTSTQTWLTYYCNDAVSLAAKDDNFKRFADIIQDEHWMGIVALNVDINLGEFPADLKALLGAMDISRFRAHNLGIEFSFIQQGPADNSVTAHKTSLFGLINYVDAGYAKETGTKLFYSAAKSSGLPAEEEAMNESTYAYKVLKLKVAFFNSAVSNFESRLQFTARKWFEDAASLTKEAADQAPDYSMFFNGKYENHDGHPTYTFVTEKGMEYLYYMSSRVLNYVQFLKARFSTSTSTAVQTDPNIEKVSGVFSFTGYLNFRKIENFDFFSCGSETEEKDKGLYFSNLAVDVAFDLHKTGNSVSNLSLNFNPSQAAFDPKNSTIRQNSLVANLPLTLTSILTGDKDNTPAKKGFIRIKPPVDFKSNALDSNKWYGLNADFLWGGPGALADKTGFVPRILLAWSPGETELRTDILICLPGGSSDKLLSIQNVLKLKIGNLQLVKVESEDKTRINYNLLLSNIALGFMGLSFPPSGNTSLALLGNPDDPGTLGWYGTYNNKG